jgi:hypothetical protein
MYFNGNIHFFTFKTHLDGDINSVLLEGLRYMANFGHGEKYPY